MSTLARPAPAAATSQPERPTLPPVGAWAVLGVLLTMEAITLPELGSDPWPFRPGPIHAHGVLAPLVRAAGRHWDVGIGRTATFAAALLCAAAALPLLRGRRWPRLAGPALVLVIGVLLMAPSTLLQMGLRESTQRWFFTNDSTYQVELAGDALLHGHNPYGRDYAHSGLERFYTFNGTVSEKVRSREVALRHLAYFPGTVATGAAWSLLPHPFDDYRLFLMLCTLATLAAALAFRAPLDWRLAIGALAVCNPIAVRSAWFGQNDAPSILLLVLAFALVTRRRPAWAGATLAGAILLKQFALVAAPFMALMLVKQRLPAAGLRRAGLAFVGVLAVGILPFLAADPGAFYSDTVRYGAGTYKIVGYGLSGILVRLHVIASRRGSYPFLPFAVAIWLPLTAWLLVTAWRARALWVSAAGFSISILVLLFIGRTFNNYYLIWPLMGAAIATLIAAGEIAGRAGGGGAGGGGDGPSAARAHTAGRGP